MTGLTVVVAIVGVVIGVVAGYLWWGAPARRRGEEDDPAARLARALAAAEAKQRKAQEDLRALEARLKELEHELQRERQRRSRLEVLVGEGRK